MSSASYRLGTRETKERPRAILTESNPLMDWNAVEVDFEQKSGGEASRASGASRVQGFTPESVVAATEVVQARSLPVPRSRWMMGTRLRVRAPTQPN